MPARTKSVTQCTGTFLFTNGAFTEVYPSEKHTQQAASASLNEFCTNIGILEKLETDRAPEFCGQNSQFLSNAKNKGINLTYSEPECKNQIWKVDIEVRELRKRTHNKMTSKNAPSRTWDFCIKHASKSCNSYPMKHSVGALDMSR